MSRTIHGLFRGIALPLAGWAVCLPLQSKVWADEAEPLAEDTQEAGFSLQDASSGGDTNGTGGTRGQATGAANPTGSTAGAGSTPAAGQPGANSGAAGTTGTGQVPLAEGGTQGETGSGGTDAGASGGTTSQPTTNTPVPPPVGSPDASSGATPLVLDLDQNGLVGTVQAARGLLVPFDLNADGLRESLEWIAPADGLLVLDLNRNGVIDDGRELFGDATEVIRVPLARPATEANGFLALAQYDGNHDGRLDRGDAVFGDLRLWRDANANGLSEPGELSTLAQHQIIALSLAYVDTAIADRSIAGSASFVGQRGQALRADGRSVAIFDVYFRLKAELAKMARR